MVAVRLAVLTVVYYFAKFSRAFSKAECDPDKHDWQAFEEDPYKFVYCDTVEKIWKVNQCPETNGVRLYFDPSQRKCVGPRIRNKRTPGIPKSSNIGEACTFNTDCKDNMYCPSGTCQCNPGYVGQPGAATCLPTINPGQTGCTENIQCSSGWPGATCLSNTCTCNPNPPYSGTVQTQDGTVCFKPGACPLPDYGDQTTQTTIDRLSATQDTETPQCLYGSTDDSTSTTTANFCNVPATVTTGRFVGDLYDCIPNAFPATVGTAPGTCCPSRSFTCIQPKIVATSGTTETRYWYNSITGGCEPFLFDKTGSNTMNSNAFLTPEFCLSYCGTACDHGPAKLANLGTPTGSQVTRTTTCTSTTDCASTTTLTYTCMTFGASTKCCPSQSFICSVYGGRQAYTTAPTGADVGVASDPALSGTLSQRWYYDTTTGTCTSFTYLGSAGNYNNFLTQSDCLSFCSTSVCDQGQPLKTATGTNQACSGGRGCPTTYECKSNLCCPRKQTVCIQPRSAGTCSSVINSYNFNPATGDCESFQYTGCGGNDNNFATYAACISFCRDIRPEPRCIQGEADKDSTGKYLLCSSSGASTCRTNYECYFDGSYFGCCPIRSWTCSLARNTGTNCITPGGRFYYDTTTRTCIAFTYGGCDGNSNNFLNRDDCERYCGAGGCPYGGQPATNAQTGQRQVCSTSGTACSSGYECQAVTLSGASLSACCLSRATICQENPQQGSTTGAPVQRYYFNPSSRTCQTFTYFGTGGNENNFATQAQCNNYCASAACGLGEAAYTDPNTQAIQTCNQQLTNSCPTGYRCLQDTLFNRFVCCGSSDMGVCPAGERAFIDAFTISPRECRIGIAGDCYNNFLCRPNLSRNRNYCCSPGAGGYCLAGYAVSRDALTLQPVSCFISTVNTCANGYSCQATSTGQIQGYCCTNNPVCPNGGGFATDGNQNPRACIISTGGVNPCPDTYTCQAATAGSTSGYCCSGTVTGVCGTLTPVVDPATNNPRVCSATTVCPTGQCTLNVQQGISYCCQSATTVDPDGCGVGLIAYRETTTNAYRTCTFGVGSNCPSGFSCQSTPTQNRCCGLSAGCPANSAAYINPSTGGAQSCAAGTICPGGFSCSNSVCCSSGTTVVPNTGICPAGVSVSTTTCVDSNSCSSGYECVPTSQGSLCCPARTSVCSQPMQPGTTSCGTSSVRYYYDSSNGICNSFTFNGCGGNDNNFATQQSCDLYCARGVCPRGDPARSGSVYQFCTNGLGCSTGFQCTTPRYGPTSTQVCCPSTTTACAQGTDGGASCGSQAISGLTRYAYNSGSRSCTAFNYFGCGGTGNNFASQAECQTACATTVVNARCPLTTQTPYIPPGSTTAQTCNPGACPANYQCVNNGQQFICCSTNANMCAAGTTVATDAATGAAINCMTRTCPTGYRCTYSASYRFYYCCSGGSITPAGTGGCPSGQSAYFTPGSTTPARCTQGVASNAIGSCPTAYSCTMSAQYSTTICCRAGTAASQPNPTASGDGCPSGSAYMYPGLANSPLACTPPNNTNCPSGYSCKAHSSMAGRYQCCSG